MGCVTTIAFAWLALGLAATLPDKWAGLGFLGVVAVWCALDDLAEKRKEGK